VTWRAAGCGLLAAAGFVAVGVVGIWRASAPPECPGLLPYQPAAFQPVGTAAAQPRLDGFIEELERAGRTSFGLASWEVWVEPGRAPATSAEPLPPRIVLACGDGTFQAYARPTE